MVHRSEGGGLVMTGLRRFVKRLSASVLGRRDDERMREEFAEHLTLLTEEYLLAGLPPDEAHRRARLKLGAPDAIAEAYRDEQRLGWLEDLGKDLRYGFRGLRRNPGFSAVAIATLALGIGANLAIFALVNAVLIRPLPYRDPEELMLVHLLGAGARRTRRLPSDNLVVPQVRSLPRRAAGLHGDELVHRPGMEPDEGRRPRAHPWRGRRGAVLCAARHRRPPRAAVCG